MISLDRKLEMLDQAGLVRRAEEFELSYQFKHILTQETVYATLLRQDRRTLHRVIADMYEEMFGERHDENLPLLAYHCEEAGDNDRASKFLLRYGAYANQISAFPEALKAFEHALALVPSDAAAERAELYLQPGDTYCRFTNYQAARQNFDVALELASGASDSKTAAIALSGLARIASQEGAHHLARELGERALQAAEEANHPEVIARAQRQLGISYNLEGNNELAKAQLQAALDTYRSLGDVDGTGSALNSLGIIAREEQDLDQANAYFQEALALSQERGDKYATGVRLGNLGVVAEARGDLQGATHFQEQAHALALEVGDREGAALTEMNLGSMALTRGMMSDALKYFQHALSELMALGSIPYALYAIALVAQWHVAQGQTERGAQLLGLALRHPASTSDIRIDFESVVIGLEQKMNNEALEEAMTRGSGLTLRQTVRELLTIEK